jgi:Trypsin-co-occurring domain 1
MPSQIVTYAVDDETLVKFEVEPVTGFTPAGADQIVGRMQEAIEPAVAAARVVLEKVREMRPDGVEVKFAVKASGTANWLIAKASAEGNFEITLNWQPGSGSDSNPGEEAH